MEEDRADSATTAMITTAGSDSYFQHPVTQYPASFRLANGICFSSIRRFEAELCYNLIQDSFFINFSTLTLAAQRKNILV